MSFSINPFAKSIQGVQGAGAFKPVGGVERVAGGNNPFSFGDDNKVGLGIKDGAIQTSNGQLGRPKAEMRQLGIA